MIDKTFVEEVRKGVDVKAVTIGGVEYASVPPDSQIIDKREPEPVASALPINTLTGIVDYVTNNFDGADLGKHALHICDHSKVLLISNLQGRFRRRETLVVAGAQPCAFKFGTWYDHENFVIALQSLFVDDAPKAELLSIIGTIKMETGVTVADDGRAQMVTAKAGIALVDVKQVPNPVLLAPWRTFREIEQPRSLFVVRLASQDKLPKVALFGADGDGWQLDAIASIKDYLREKLPQMQIIA
jgi:hypothetical protein